MNLTPRVKKIIAWVAYPLAYVFFFCAFAYWTFPYERLKQRIVVGYNAAQRGKPDANRMQIADATWSWAFPGVVLRDVALIGPKPPPPEGGEKATPRRHVHIDEVYARVAPLSYLLGTTQVNFSATGFGGELSGTFAQSTAATELHVEFDEVNPGQLPGVVEALQLPLSGSLSGTVELTLPEGKYGAADGNVQLEIADLEIGDGKTKVRDLIALPTVQAGTLTLEATVTQGRVKIDSFETKGPDLEADAEGKLRLRDRLEQSRIEQLTLGFKFSDKYRDKDDKTRSLLGKPGDKFGGLLEMNPQGKQAKQPDGSFRWRVSGLLTKPTFLPSRPGAPGARQRAPVRRPPRSAPSAP